MEEAAEVWCSMGRKGGRICGGCMIVSEYGRPELPGWTKLAGADADEEFPSPVA